MHPEVGGGLSHEPERGCGADQPQRPRNVEVVECFSRPPIGHALRLLLRTQPRSRGRTFAPTAHGVRTRKNFAAPALGFVTVSTTALGGAASDCATPHAPEPKTARDSTT